MTATCCARPDWPGPPVITWSLHRPLRTFPRSFTFGHVCQLDRVLADTLTRAWAASAGPRGRCRFDRRGGVRPLQVGRRVRLHPPSAATTRSLRRAHTGKVLHVRLRTGSANTSRGMLRCWDELIARRARGRYRPETAARRRGVLVEQDLGSPPPRRLAVLDRHPAPTARSHGDRADRRARLADPGNPAKAPDLGLLFLA